MINFYFVISLNRHSIICRREEFKEMKDDCVERGEFGFLYDQEK